MDGVKPDDTTVSQTHPSLNRGDFVLHEKAEFGIDERKAAVKDHAVGVLKRARDDVRIVGFEILHLLGPPVVGFSEKYDVWLELVEECAENLRAAVLHEDVRSDEMEVALALAGHHFLARKVCVRADLEQLGTERRHGEAEESAICTGEAVPPSKSATATKCGPERELEPGKIERANSPVP
jgi:hypothetical protein